MSYGDPNRKHGMRSAWQNFNRVDECLRSSEIQMNCSVVRGRHIGENLGGCNVIPAGVVKLEVFVLRR